MPSRGTPCRLWERRAAGMSSGTEVPKRPVQRLCRCAEGKRLAEEARETNSDGPRPPSASRQPAGGGGEFGHTGHDPGRSSGADGGPGPNHDQRGRFGPVWAGFVFQRLAIVKKGAKVAPGAGGVRAAAGTGPRPFAYRQTHNFPESRSSGPHGIPPIYFTRTYTYVHVRGKMWPTLASLPSFWRAGPTCSAPAISKRIQGKLPIVSVGMASRDTRPGRALAGTAGLAPGALL